MATKNSLLLIIKQGNGVNYNELLSRTSAGYSGINSARAALSRSLKDMVAVGFIARKANRIYITEKGTLSIGTEMKHKLLMKLNSLINAGNAHASIDAIVQNLNALIERSKQDNELLRAARGSADFYIGDLEQIGKDTAERLKQLEYLNGVFSKQLDALKELDFNDKAEFPADRDSLKRIVHEMKLGNKDDVIIETADSESAERLAEQEGVKAKKNTVTLKATKIARLFSMMEKGKVVHARAYLGPLVLGFVSGRVVISGPYSIIANLRENAAGKQPEQQAFP
jgi:hypothetical protein